MQVSPVLSLNFNQSRKDAIKAQSVKSKSNEKQENIDPSRVLNIMNVQSITFVPLKINRVKSL